MKRTILKLILLIVSAIAFQSCSKYEDNPPFSMRTKNARLIGEWKLIKGEITEINNYSIIKNKFERDSVFFVVDDFQRNKYAYLEKITIKDDGYYTIESKKDNIIQTKKTCMWTWIDDNSRKDQIMFIDTLQDKVIMTIKKLTNKELILEEIKTYDLGRTRETLMEYRKQ